MTGGRTYQASDHPSDLPKLVHPCSSGGETEHELAQAGMSGSKPSWLLQVPAHPAMFQDFPGCRRMTQVPRCYNRGSDIKGEGGGNGKRGRARERECMRTTPP